MPTGAQHSRGAAALLFIFEPQNAGVDLQSLHMGICSNFSPLNCTDPKVTHDGSETPEGMFTDLVLFQMLKVIVMAYIR